MGLPRSEQSAQQSVHRAARQSIHRAQRVLFAGVAASLAAVVCVAPSALAQCNYEVIAIIDGPPCKGFSGTAPVTGTAMNSHGDVVGYWQSCTGPATRAFFWSQETGRIDLPHPPGVTSSTAMGVNDHRIIVGQHIYPASPAKGFVYDLNNPAAGFVYLEPLHKGVIATTVSNANAINNSNVAVGSRAINLPGQPVVTNAIIWRPFEKGSPVQDLGVMHGPSSAALVINDQGDAAGWAGSAYTSSDNRAILWLDGKGLDLGVLPGMVKSLAKHLNNHREVVGLSQPVGGFGLHFFWKNGRVEPLLPPPGYDVIGSTDYSTARQMTGHIRVEGTTTFHPLLWQHGTFYNLTTLLVDPPAGFQIAHSSALAGDGLILCRSSLNGRVVAAVLAPISRPMTDLDFDCRTDIHDLLILLEQWGPLPRAVAGGTGSSADFNQDGRVDVLDLLILLGNWG